MGEYMLKKIFYVLKIVVFVHLFLCLINRMNAAFFICLFSLFLLYIVDYLQNKVEYSDLFQLLIYIFLIGSLIGGEVYFLYVKLWYFDIIMHVLSSYIISGLIYYILIKNSVNINFNLFLLFIFSFAMMIASLWEITEFTIDRFFITDMQKDTIINEIKSSYISYNGKNVVVKEVNNIKLGNYVINGYLDIGLYDTIYDMICALFGSFLFLFKIKRSVLL